MLGSDGLLEVSSIDNEGKRTSQAERRLGEQSYGMMYQLL